MHAHVEDIHGGQVAGGGRAYHLAVVDDAHVGSAHGVQVFIVFVVDEDDIAQPIALAHKLFDVLLAGGASVRADNSDKVVEGAGLGREGSRRRVLEQELADAFPGSLGRELGLLKLVTWRVKDDCRVICDAILLPPRCPNASNGLLDVVV